MSNNITVGNDEKITIEKKIKQPLLEIRELKKFFPVKGTLRSIGRAAEQVKAVNDISFKLYEGETYGLVGESGCGKSTTGRSILRLTEPTSGKVLYNGKNVLEMSNRKFKDIRQQMQIIFQDPHSSLNPRKRVGKTLEEALTIHSLGTRENRTDTVLNILERVGMRTDQYYRYPHELSGGQKQRIGIARALIVDPEIIIADEPVSALDVSIQAQVLNLLQELQEDFKLTYIFIAHDISVVRHISDRIGVMYLGKIVEESPSDELLKKPLHPYTQSLLSAVPETTPQNKKERIVLKGEVPTPIDPPKGCVFNTRCPHVMDICKEVIPETKEIYKNHYVSCHLYND